jgi:hypothetical protein
VDKSREKTRLDKSREKKTRMFAMSMYYQTCPIVLKEFGIPLRNLGLCQFPIKENKRGNVCGIKTTWNRDTWFWNLKINKFRVSN